MTAFALTAILLTVIVVGTVTWPLLRSGDSVHPIAATLTALAIPGAVLITYLLVSTYDWTASGGSVPTPANAETDPGIAQAISSLEQKLAESPNDEEGWILLGSSYLSLQRPADALAAYQKALDLSGGRNAAARLGVAESRIVLDPAALSGAAGADIEQVLADEPRNAKALWYGGLLSLTKGEVSAARNRWQTLLELNPPERVRAIITAQLQALDEEATRTGSNLAQPASVADSPVARTNSDNGATDSVVGAISINVVVSDSVRAQIAKEAPLFIFVRDAGTRGPPLAVVRRQAHELPLKIAISDADLMLPGRTLAALDSAVLVARVANGGDPIAQVGDVYGEARWTRNNNADGSPVSIVIDQVVKP